MRTWILRWLLDQPWSNTGSTNASVLRHLCSQDRRLGAALHVELGQQTGDIVLDRLLGEEQPLADLPVRQPFRDQVENLAFAARKAGQAGSRTAGWRSRSSSLPVTAGSSRERPAATGPDGVGERLGRRSA